MEELFENSRIHFYESEGSPTHKIIYYYLEIICALIGIFFDILIIYVIFKNKKMRSKVNIILLNWCIMDALHSFGSTYSILYQLYLLIGEFSFKLTLACLDRELIIFYQGGCVIFIIIMISNTLMKGKKTTVKSILVTTYTLLGALLISDVGQCHLSMPMTLRQIYMVDVLGLILFLTTIIKDINWCYKRNRKPVSDSTVYRLNFGRIFVYNLLIAVIFGVIRFLVPYELDKFLRIFVVTRFLAPVYFFVYLYQCDKRFNICVWSIYNRRKEDAINFYDEESEEDEPRKIQKNIINV